MLHFRGSAGQASTLQADAAACGPERVCKLHSRSPWSGTSVTVKNAVLYRALRYVEDDLGLPSPAVNMPQVLSRLQASPVSTTAGSSAGEEPGAARTSDLAPQHSVVAWCCAFFVPGPTARPV